MAVKTNPQCAPNGASANDYAVNKRSQTFYSLYQIEWKILGPVCVTKNPWFVDKKWFTPGTTPTIYKHNRIKW